MAKTTVEIPDERLAELEAYKEKLGELLLLGLSQVKIQEALLLYKRGLVSLGRAAELAGISERDMIRQARAADIEPAWSANPGRGRTGVKVFFQCWSFNGAMQIGPTGVIVSSVWSGRFTNCRLSGSCHSGESAGLFRCTAYRNGPSQKTTGCFGCDP